MSYELFSNNDNYAASGSVSDYTLSIADCNGLVRIQGNQQVIVPASLPNGFNCLVQARFGTVTFAPEAALAQAPGQKLKLASPKTATVLIAAPGANVPRELIIVGDLS